MQINGKELGMAYTTGAHLDFQDWVVSHPKDSLAHAQIESVIIMHKWWCLLNSVPEKDRVTREEILALPHAGNFDEMLTLAQAIMKGDKQQSVEAKVKNPEGAGGKE